MLMFIIQAFLLIAIAYILGCVVGNLLHWIFAGSDAQNADSNVDAGLGTAAAATAVGSVAANAAPSSRSMHVEPAPPQPVTAVSSSNVKAEAAEARRKAEAEKAARLKAEEEARLKAEAAAKAQARAKAEAEAREKAEAEAEAATAKAKPAAAKKAKVEKTKSEKAPAKKAKAEKAKSAKAPAKKARAEKAPAKKVPAKKATPDDLKLIRGIGPQNEARLNSIDITTFKQIAGWGKRKQAEVGERLAFPGRIEREDWVGQAKVLAKGKSTEFSERVAKGRVGSSIGKVTKADLGKSPRSLPQPRKSGADDLTKISGVGKSIEKKLNALGIFHYDQISKWSAANQQWIGYEIGHPGRVEREDWASKAAQLAGK